MHHLCRSGHEILKCDYALDAICTVYTGMTMSFRYISDFNKILRLLISRLLGILAESRLNSKYRSHPMQIILFAGAIDAPRINMLLMDITGALYNSVNLP